LNCRQQVELASVADTVSKPLIGKMRMQFWRDALKDMSEVNFVCCVGCLAIETLAMYRASQLDIL
jgi:hypothetical protein